MKQIALTAIVLLAMKPMAVAEDATATSTAIEQSAAPVFISWNAHSTQITSCPPEKDPYTGQLVYKNNQTSCTQDIIDPKWNLYDKNAEAEHFKSKCPRKTCSDWVIRPATKKEIQDWYIRENHWTFSQLSPTAWISYGGKLDGPDYGYNGIPAGAGASYDAAVESAIIMKKLNWRWHITGDRGHPTFQIVDPSGNVKASGDAPDPVQTFLAARGTMEVAYNAAHPETSKTWPPKEEAAAGAEKAEMQWVSIPGGSFVMGSEDSDLLTARPTHQVTVKSFEMAKTLVTNKQYKACVAAGGCTPAHVSDKTCFFYHTTSDYRPMGWIQSDLADSFQGDDQPVVCVDQEQAKAFAAWVGGRLPTESEWEYAARSGGKDQKYPWGNQKANCDRAVIQGCGSSTGQKIGGAAKNFLSALTKRPDLAARPTEPVTAPVCSKPAGNTAQGLCDMAGNVWEWVEDWDHDSYNGAPIDGSPWVSAGSSFSNRVSRGGCAFTDGGYVRSAYRNNPGADRRDYSLGFRVAR